MEARINVITLGVSDLQRALDFYRDGLGLRSPGIIGTEFPGDETFPSGAVAMFQLDGGLILAVWPRPNLARDANVPVSAPSSCEFSVAHSVGSREEVDAVIAQARAAGATVTDSGRDRPWGIYSGYFQDPDGHLWEILFNPQLDWALPS
jgi:catechol 2,3-dioxygenase-like lactoylglutathione lyase family enzyme